MYAFLTSNAVQIQKVQFLSKMAPSTLGVGHWELRRIPGLLLSLTSAHSCNLLL